MGMGQDPLVVACGAVVLGWVTGLVRWVVVEEVVFDALLSSPSPSPPRWVLEVVVEEPFGAWAAVDEPV
jgi:hypothetical protein